MRKSVRVTFNGSATYLTGTASLPTLTRFRLGFVILRHVKAGDVFEPDLAKTPVEARWLLVPKASIETLAEMRD